jgi:hypothetical protein
MLPVSRLARHCWALLCTIYTNQRTRHWGRIILEIPGLGSVFSDGSFPGKMVGQEDFESASISEMETHLLDYG